jgi:ADP-L-glycero-D-manno-heptose 6-epimerase
MIVLTGAAGFIGSVMASALNGHDYTKLILVDDFSKTEKAKNLEDKEFYKKIDRNEFVAWFEEHYNLVEFVIHIGARTDTAEFDMTVFDKLNLNYTKDIWNLCSVHQIPMIYASSAATYGSGEHGYKDSHDIVEKLQPLNPYGVSKNDFDKWALKQDKQPPFWAGLKFFNVYGPNEYHKSRMASVIFHTYHQIKEKGKMKLFRSHRPDFEDGEQLRDFVYVRDLAKVILFLMDKQPESGLYNLGTGTARSFNDLARNTFIALGLEPKISYRDTPEDIRDKYQYFTEADMTKLLEAGYDDGFYTLEEGVKDYVQNFLMTGEYL